MSHGYPGAPGYPGTPSGPTQGNGMAVAALIIGLFGLLLSVVVGWIPIVGFFLVFIPTVLAIVFGIVGRGRARQGAPHGGIAAAGLACGLIGLLLTIGIQVLWAGIITRVARDPDVIEQFQKVHDEVQQQMEAEFKEIQGQLEVQIDEGAEAKPEAAKEKQQPPAETPASDPATPAKSKNEPQPEQGGSE